ncbi:Mitochondrial distribution and morphology protein 10 [Elasticomyces elasticus]|nr:Mitochondrial distribution and morphology protein 10 [Elasticomyces elasticus]
MLEFMDYVQTAFCQASNWNHDNSYRTLTATAHGKNYLRTPQLSTYSHGTALLDFHTPSGLRLHISSLSAPNFATSYTVGSKGVLDGSLSFLYSSLGLQVPSKSSDINLHHLIRGYRQLQDLRKPDELWWSETWHGGRRVDNRGMRIETIRPPDALLYGRLYLPASELEALYIRRLSPTRLLTLSAVSNSNLPNGGTILGLLQNDCGKYTTECLYSTDSALLGVRGLYNFGLDPRKPPSVQETLSPTKGYGRFSLGGELYFSPLNKSGGLSTGLRFTTLPSHPGFPYTMTVTLNPLVGNLSSTYAVKAGRNLALCTRFDFNFYSYESDVQIGMELWRMRKPDAESEWARKMLRPDWALAERIVRGDESVNGVLKARVDQNWKIGVLWESRIKELLVGIGAGFDLKRRDRVLDGVGIEVSYSS